jgi:hypothetical protein
MADIRSVYGNSFQEESIKQHSGNLVKLFSTNLANKEFKFNISSCDLWHNNSLSTDIVMQLISSVQAKNQSMRLTHVAKQSSYINMFPYILKTPAEYFILTDLKERKFYSIYITPEKIDVL